MLQVALLRNVESVARTPKKPPLFIMPVKTLVDDEKNQQHNKWSQLVARRHILTLFLDLAITSTGTIAWNWVKYTSTQVHCDYRDDLLSGSS